MMNNTGLKKLIIASGLSLTALVSSTGFADQCSFVAHKPKNFLHNIVNSFARVNVSVIPSKALRNDRDNAWDIVDRGMFRGYLVYNKRLEDDIDQVSAFDSSGKVLFSLDVATGIQESSRGEPVGRFDMIRYYSKRSPSVGKTASFNVISSPAGIDYFLYNQKTNVTIWRNDFDAEMAWFGRFITESEGRAIAPPATVEGRFALSLSYRPELIPYIGSIQFTQLQNGSTVINGVVPNSNVYSAILQAAARAGMSRVIPKMTIDSRVERPTRSDLPQIESCY